MTGRQIRWIFVVVGAFGAGCAQRAETISDRTGAFDLRLIERARVLPIADRFLLEKPSTIVDFPAQPRGGSTTPAGKHDFYSESDYAWPDAAHPGGPFIGRDGYSYPDAFFDHRRAMWRFDTIVPTVTAAFLLTKDHRYVDCARSHLRAWFVDVDTRMNPSLDYAQAIPNKATGTQYGIIDTLHLVEVARSVTVLRRERQLTADEDAAISKWFAEYIQWLRTSKPGMNESNGKNNHSTAYWLQIAAFAQVTGDESLLEEARHRFKTQLFPHMAADGSFPLELKRSKPYGYSLFELDLMVMLAHVVSTPNDNLFEFAGADGRTLRTALEYMYPFVKDKSKWPLAPDVMVYDKWPVRSPAFLYGGLAYHEPRYLRLWQSLDSAPSDQEILRNLPIRQPLLWE